MTSIFLRNLTSKGPKHCRLESIKLDQDVNNLRKHVSGSTKLSSEEFELVYCGKLLQDGDSLSKYGVQTGSTIYIVKRMKKQEETTPEKIDKDTIKHIVNSLQTAMQHPAFRTLLDKMLENSEAIENIVTATPELDKDPVAVAMLRDPEMLAVMADPNLIHKAIEAHPSLGPAAMMVAAAINEEISTGSHEAVSRSSRAGTYSLDQMSDEEDMDTGMPRSSRANTSITPSQLAAALAGVSAISSPQQPQAGTSQSASSSSSQGQITSDFFQQAMAQALGQGAAQQQLTDQQQQPPEDVTQSQLAQLRDMGITDEAVARQALAVTGGDIQAALEILFGDALS